MSRRRTALAAALSLLPLGQPLLLGSTTALATAAVVLSTQAAHAQSADDYVDRGVAKYRLRDYQGAIADYSKAIEINPQYADAYNNRGIAKYMILGDYQGACADYKKAVSLGHQSTAQYLNSEDGAWCRNLPTEEERQLEAQLRSKNFHTPSRNIWCRYYYGNENDDFLFCEVAKHKWTVWDCEHDGCIGWRFTLRSSGKSSNDNGRRGTIIPLNFLSISYNGAGELTNGAGDLSKRLDYGQRLKLGSIICDSATKGLTCRNSRGGSFHLNREFYLLNGKYMSKRCYRCR